ncbi:MAG: IS5 family transposase [Chloroflexi bacterium]|nr:IS5 family transposase [Chloroflexota bacterium]
MRGDRDQQANMLLAITPDQMVPQDHPVREIKSIVEHALTGLSPVFNQMYSRIGRPSIPPEQLLKSSLLIALYSVRSERQFCERLQYDLLFKWFLDLNISDPAFNPTTFSKNRERLLEHEVSRRFFDAVVSEARRRNLLSDDHFTVDGTLLDAWASLKSFRPVGEDDPPPGSSGSGGRNREVDFKGERRLNSTHRSTTDPEARLARKGPGKEARLSFAGHVLMENRNGLVVDTELTEATGTAEERAAIRMLKRIPGKRRITVGADKGYDTGNFVDTCWVMNTTAHVARKRLHSAIDGRTTRHASYRQSQRVRKRVEEIFGWMKTVGGSRKLRYRGTARNGLWFEVLATAYNLVRMAKIAAKLAQRPPETAIL